LLLPTNVVGAASGLRAAEPASTIGFLLVQALSTISSVLPWLLQTKRSRMVAHQSGSYMPGGFRRAPQQSMTVA
jgi:hypothetical protein